ncbi:MAG TPA: ABC-F type ribosomal protection protein [Clostridiales bacterium]|nr:ABC-F type ribosomal protection protein [Clostridiales bacterium]
MIVLSCNQIQKSFGVDTILENISFTVNAGERIGIIGANGSGKSTLLKIIAGILPHDKGEIYISKNTSIGYLEQTPLFSSENTVWDEALRVFENLLALEKELRQLEQQIAQNSTESSSNILDNLMKTYAQKLEEFEQKNGYGYQSEIRGILSGLGFSEEDFSKPVEQLSGGQKSRLSLAKLLLENPNILLLDEPTNHLDIEAIEWLESFLKFYPGTILLISHDRYFLDKIAEKIYEIENRQLTVYTGNYTNYAKNKKILYEKKLKDYLQQKAEIEAQEQIIRKLKQHGTEKMAKRAKSREKMLERMTPVEKPFLSNTLSAIRFETQIKSGEDVLTVKELSKSFSDVPLFQNISFQIYRGEKVALIGPNGIGKTTILKILLGQIAPDTGTVQLGHNVQIGYYDQEQKLLDENSTVLEEIWSQNIHMTQTQVRTLLGSFLFQGDDVFKKVSELSGGEKSRLALLKLILSRANFLILDEPTNHLDMVSKEILEDALLRYEGTVLTVSHDRYFLNKFTDKTLVLSSEGLETYLGNYQYYEEKKQELEEISKREAPETQKTKTQIRYERKKERETLLQARKAKKEQEEIEARISLLEEKIHSLDHQMCLPEVYTNPEKSKKIHEESNRLKEELQKLYEIWETYLE